MPQNVAKMLSGNFYKFDTIWNNLGTFTSARIMLSLVNINKWVILSPVFQILKKCTSAFKPMGCTLTDDIIVVKKNYISGSSFWGFSKYTSIWANFYPFFAILLAKITNIWGTIASISKNLALSDIPNQLMTKLTKTGKSTDIYSFSWIFSFKNSEKCW